MSFLRITSPSLHRACVALAILLGAAGVLLGLVPLFFGLAWNFGGAATLLALCARRSVGATHGRLWNAAAEAGFVLGVSAVLIGFGDLLTLGWP